jgi:carbonic anhydrase
MPYLETRDLSALAAALQFALEHNRIETIIVLGHTNCGAIKALVDETDDPEISSFVNVARHALTKAKSCCDTQDAVIAQTEREIILESAENIKSYPSVAKALAERRAVIKAWQFDMNDGNLLEYDEEEKDFIILNNAAHTQDSRQE